MREGFCIVTIVILSSKKEPLMALAGALTTVAMGACGSTVFRHVALTPLQPASNVVHDNEETMDADRPHVGTGTHLVRPGQIQFELGGQFNSFGSRRTYGSPVLGRIGITDSIEARFGFDGLIGQRDDQGSAQSIGNAQLAAKVRVRGEREAPWLSIMPSMTLGLASADKGLGSGENDVSLTLLAGGQVAGRTHAEANYGVAAVGGGHGRGYFLQHLMTGAVVYNLTSRLSTYGEIASWSKQEINGGAVRFADFGVIHSVHSRLIVDAGGAVGLSEAAPRYIIFAGLSFLLERESSHRPPRVLPTLRREQMATRR